MGVIKNMKKRKIKMSLAIVGLMMKLELMGAKN